jgi:hypothetical protein
MVHALDEGVVHPPAIECLLILQTIFAAASALQIVLLRNKHDGHVKLAWDAHGTTPDALYDTLEYEYAEAHTGNSSASMIERHRALNDLYCAVEKNKNLFAGDLVLITELEDKFTAYQARLLDWFKTKLGYNLICRLRSSSPGSVTKEVFLRRYEQHLFTVPGVDNAKKVWIAAFHNLRDVLDARARAAIDIAFDDTDDDTVMNEAVARAPVLTSRVDDGAVTGEYASVDDDDDMVGEAGDEAEEARVPVLTSRVDDGAVTDEYASVDDDDDDEVGEADDEAEEARAPVLTSRVDDGAVTDEYATVDDDDDEIDTHSVASTMVSRFSELDDDDADDEVDEADDEADKVHDDDEGGSEDTVARLPAPSSIVTQSEDGMSPPIIIFDTSSNESGEDTVDGETEKGFDEYVATFLAVPSKKRKGSTPPATSTVQPTRKSARSNAGMRLKFHTYYGKGRHVVGTPCEVAEAQDPPPHHFRRLI